MFGNRHPLLKRSGTDQAALDLVDPLQTQVLDLWNGLRAGSKLPPRSAFDPIAIASGLSRVFLVENRPEGWFYRVVGGEIVREVGFEATGRLLATLSLLIDTERVGRDFDIVARTAMPWRHVFNLPVIGRDWIVYDRLLLPFGTHLESDRLPLVTHVLGVCAFDC